MPSTVISLSPALEAPAAATFKQLDWDAHGVIAIHVPSLTARAALVKLGWDVSAEATGGPIKSPNGEAYWHASDALAVALEMVAIS